LIPLAKPDLGGNELKYLTECITTGYVTHAGRFESAFEEAFSKRFGVSALATSCGTGALHLALLSLGIGVGDEVIVPNLSFGAVASVVLAVGARPVLVDVDERTFGLDKNRILAVLNKKARAIIAVHLYGCDAGDFRQFGLPVIEDSCEALGLYPPRGRMQAYSFYGNKPITTGEGGMLCGDFAQARAWRDGGFDENYRHDIPGLNYRMSNMQAALGLAQIERIDELLARRKQNVKLYAKNLKGKGNWLFLAETENPIALSGFLSEHGIETRPVFTPLHLCPAFKVYKKGHYKVSEEIWAHHLALPTGPHVGEKEINKISELIHGSGHLRSASN